MDKILFIMAGGLVGFVAATWLSLHNNNHLLKQIIMTQEELAQALRDAKVQADKAKSEIVGKISDLETAIGNAGSTTPEVDAALAELKAAVQGVDDIVADTTV